VTIEQPEARRDSKPAEAHRSFAGIFTGRDEHTAGGWVVGVARDLLDFGHQGTAISRAQRAASNDHLAEIVGDTAAFLPALRWTGAGLIRAAILYDPHENLSSNAFGLGRNFLEGAALNKVGGLAAPEGAFARLTAARLGNGLAAETVTNLSVGLGMGVVRTGFDPQAWKDSGGRFSLAAGSENLLKAGTVGALVNVPAGMVGLRIGRASSLAVAEGRISAPVANLIAGWGAGYASGSVFGGMDALMSGRSWTDVLAAANESGLVGGFTGAALQHYGTSRASARDAGGNRAEAPGKLPRLQSAVEQKQAGGDSAYARGDNRVVKVKPEGSDGWLNVPIETWQRLNITPERAPDLNLLGSRLGLDRYQRSTEAILSLSKEPSGRYTSWETFANDVLQRKHEPVRLYTVEGLTTRIVVPEGYARELDQVRNLRLLAQGKGAAATAPEDLVGRVEAEMALEKHPYGYRMLPEEFIPYLEALPDRTAVKRLLVLPDANPADPYFRQIYSPNFWSSASASEDGLLTFYAKERNLPGSNWINWLEMGHEAAHVYKARYPEESALFDLAAELESELRGGFFPREYGKARMSETDPHGENWAVLGGESLQSADADRFLVAAWQAPIRSSVYGRALVRALSSVPAAERSPYHETYLQRVAYLDREILPRAQAKLVQHIQSGDPLARATASELLGTLGNQSHVELLSNVARTSADRRTAEAAYFSAIKLAGSSRARFDLMVELAAPGSAVRNIALDNLGRLNSWPAAQYKRLLELAGDARNVSAIVKLVGQMPDARGNDLAFREVLSQSRQRRMLQPLMEMMDSNFTSASQKQQAFEAGLSVLSGKPDQQVNLSLRTITLHPELRASALEFFTRSPVPEVERYAERYATDADPVVAANAQAVLQAIRSNRNLARLTSQVSFGTPAAQLAAARELARMSDIRAIRPLLMAGASGNKTLRNEVALAMSSFTPNLVKFQARELSRAYPHLGPALQEILYSKH